MLLFIVFVCCLSLIYARRQAEVWLDIFQFAINKARLQQRDRDMHANKSR